MTYPWRTYPKLEVEHVRNGRLFADREDMIRSIGAQMVGWHQPSTMRVAEIGVAFGGFSEILLDAFRPEEFVAFDLFDMEKFETVWGRSTEEAFGGKTHYEYYRNKFADRPVTLVKGNSADTLKGQPDSHFDIIYIDGDHSYDGCKADAEQAVRMLKRDGVIVFNDYIMWDHAGAVPYGVVAVANELIVNDGWEVIGFALNHSMYCDLAVRRRKDRPVDWPQRPRRPRP